MQMHKHAWGHMHRCSWKALGSLLSQLHMEGFQPRGSTRCSSHSNSPRGPMVLAAPLPQPCCWMQRGAGWAWGDGVAGSVESGREHPQGKPPGTKHGLTGVIPVPFYEHSLRQQHLVQPLANHQT